MSLWEDNWDEFSAELQKKLASGYKEHGDGSFSRAPEDLVKEMLEECLDIAGWGLVLWARTKRMEAHYDQMRQEFAALQQARDKLLSTK